MKYIIATDYDSTLYQYHKGGISKEVVDAIKDFREKGNLFGVVSGRCFQWAYPSFKKDGLFPFDFILSNSGSCAVDAEGNELFCDYIRKEKCSAKKLMSTLVSLCDIECGIEIDKKWTPICAECRNPEEEPGYFNDLSVVDKVGDFVSAGVVFSDSEKCKEGLKALEKEFGDVLTFSQNSRNIDISAKGVNKATGIKKYADLMGVNTNHIYAAGDNYNDIPMVSAYHGCAVSNAVDELKEKAEYVCEDLAELIKIILSKENNNG